MKLMADKLSLEEFKSHSVIPPILYGGLMEGGGVLMLAKSEGLLPTVGGVALILAGIGLDVGTAAYAVKAARHQATNKTEYL